MKSLPFAMFLTMLAAGCAVPKGPYGLHPEMLVDLPRERAASPLPPCPTSGDALVMKRFESQALSPVGALFRSPDDDLEIMAQTYASDGDLSLVLFEATVEALRSAGCVTWRDYAAHPEAQKGPPRTTDYVVLSGVVQELEIDTFGVAKPEDAARTHLRFVVHDVTGEVLQPFEVNAEVRIARGDGDLLRALGRKVAAQIIRATRGSP
jgi:hypothetical protein